MSDLRTVGDALGAARAITAQPGAVLSPAAAQALLAYVVGRGRAWLLAHADAPLSAADADRYRALLDRAAGGEPLAHLLGEREFYGLAFTITPDVLVPRPETEALVDALRAWAARSGVAHPRIVDVGTGSGAVAVAAAVHVPAARVVAVELSGAALSVARGNAQRHGVSERVRFVQGDLLAALAGPFDVIAANLPYINRDEIAALEVGRWEPWVALDGGVDGLELVRRLLAQAPARLAAGGLLVLEIGYDQGERTAALCQRAFPTANVTLQPDLAGLDRIVSVNLP